MSQEDIYIFLKKNRGIKFTSKEISEKIEKSLGSSITSLSILRKKGEVNYEFNERSSKSKGYLYWIK